jgi:L-aspartate oxidase
MPLASEALRGEGCILIDEKGRRFINEMQPRDVVARAIWAERAAGRKVFLDGRTALGSNFAKRFPTIYASCLSADIDPATMPIPVSPAAHYHMGGVVTDLHGRSTVEGLWACGEVASTGLHGANRLASNSLLEAASFGCRVAEDIAGQSISILHSVTHQKAAERGNSETHKAIRSIMSRGVGVLRDAVGLEEAVKELAVLQPTSGMALVGLMIAVSALRREESRGAHTRTDFPVANLNWQHHQHITLADIEPYLEPATLRRANGV